MNADQSAVLATIPHTLNLMISIYVDIADDGTAFVDALVNRSSSFGSLAIEYAYFSPVDTQNLKRLFQVELLETITLTDYSGDAECAGLPFSAKVNALVYQLNPQFIQL